MRSSPSTAAKSCRNRMCRQGGKYAVWVDFLHGDSKIGASRKFGGKEEAFKIGSRKQLFHARNFCGGGVRRGLPPRLDIRQPPLGILWLLSVAKESNNVASADATGAASKTMPVFMNASSPQLSVKNRKICSRQQHFQKKIHKSPRWTRCLTLAFCALQAASAS